MINDIYARIMRYFGRRSKREGRRSQIRIEVCLREDSFDQVHPAIFVSTSTCRVTKGC